MSRRYGWIPDVVDDNDPIYQVPLSVGSIVPTRVDLRSLCPCVYDQGNLGSSTANAIAAAMQVCQKKQGQVNRLPARLFLYYNERNMVDAGYGPLQTSARFPKNYFSVMGDVKYMSLRKRSILKGTLADGDTGAMLRDGLKSAATVGVPPETMYNPAKFTDKPSDEAYAEALNHRIIRYERIPRDIALLKACLAEGFPFVFGIAAYETLESVDVAKTGVLNLPKTREQLLGGQAVMAVTYDDAYQRFMCRNSFGRTWGINGHFTIPYSYVLNSNLAADFWMVRSIS